MGNANATLAIALDQEAVFAGSVVSGKVYLDVKKDTDASSLQLILEGKEHSHTHWTESHGSGDNRHTEHHHAYANRTLIKLTFDLAEFPGGKVAIGQYEFPFSAELPPGLPSTMYASGQGGDCRIAYSFRARMHRPGLFKWDTKAKRSFLVSSMPLPPEPQPYFAAPSTTAVKMLCCINRGRMTVGAVATDTLISRGETFNMNVALKNESTAKIDAMRAEIEERVVWWAGGHSNWCLRKVAQGFLDPSTIAGTAKLDKAELKAVREDGNSKGQALEEIYAQLCKADQPVAVLTCADDARDTYRGPLISTSHDMRAVCKTPCCITDPVVHIPVRIGAPSLVVVAPVPTAVPLAAAAVVVTTTTTTTTTTTSSTRNATPVMALPQKVPVDKDEKATIQVATALPEGWAQSAVVAECVVVPMAAATIGGRAQQGGDPDADAEEELSHRATQVGEPGSFERLMKVMDDAYDDHYALDMLLRSEDREAWKALFAALDPNNFAAIVAQVNLASMQAPVAALLAKERPGFSAAFLLASLASCAADFKVQVVNALAPLCLDLADAKQAIEASLSEWERVLVRKALEGSGA